MVQDYVRTPFTFIENGTHYISFADKQGIAHNLEVDTELYELFDGLKLEDISYMNIISRHMEQSELTEEALNRRAADQSESMEDNIAKRIIYQKLHTTVAQLPELQRRRVLLYYYGGYTYEQIAKMEGCTKRAIKIQRGCCLGKSERNFVRFF